MLRNVAHGAVGNGRVSISQLVRPHKPPIIGPTGLLSRNPVVNGNLQLASSISHYLGARPIPFHLNFPRPALFEVLALRHAPSISQNIFIYASRAWARNASTRASKRAGVAIRNSSSVSNEGPRGSKSAAKESSQASSKSTKAIKSTSKVTASKQILDRLPHLHRPTKEELLAAASGFWHRLAIRFKWFSIKSVRPFNMDEITGFITWIFVGHFLWILFGTTAFFSLAIFMVNTVFAQETLGKWVGEYLTQSSGLQVVFESAIVPKWKDGVISFSNVFVSRRPGKGKAKVSKGSQAEAAAAAANAELALHHEHDHDDGNYTQFDISIETVNVTLSFAKWFNGKGLLRDVEVRGIRGVVDRTHVKTDDSIDPRSYKHQHETGDFELDSFKMEDVLVTVYQPDNFRPFSISIFSCDLPQLRRQWLFYDFMSANTISGSIDNSLFTLHPRQTNNFTGNRLNEIDYDGEIQWKKMTRLRIDGLSIDHLNRGVSGPFSWIKEGNVDIIADLMFPTDDDESVAKVLSDVLDRVEATVITNSIPNIDNTPKHTNSKDFLSSTELEENVIKQENDNGIQCLVMDMRINFNDVRATVPVFTNDISYVNNALIRPIVAYINTRRAYIPIHCRVVKTKSEFDGSWSLYDSGLMEDLNKEAYEAFVRDIVNDRQVRRRQIKNVGIWTIQLAAQALFLGMAGNFA